MNKLIAIAVLGFILLASSISYAGDELSSSDKSFLFSGKGDVAVKFIDDAEASSTRGKLTIGIVIDNSRGIIIAVDDPNIRLVIPLLTFSR